MIFTIIVPCYNSEKSISRTLESIQAQTFDDYECLIIDDGSTDETREACLRFTVDRRFRYLHKPNGGPGSARNLGIVNSQARYIALLDSDDTWYPDKLERMQAQIQRHQADICYHNMHVCINGKPTRKVLGRKYRSRNASRALLSEGYLMPTSSVVILSELLKREMFNESPELLGIEDYELMLRLTRHDVRISHLNTCLGNYFIGTDNLSRAFNIISRSTSLLKLHPELLNYSHFHYGIGISFLAREKPARAMTAFYLAACLSPDPMTLIKIAYQLSSFLTNKSKFKQ